MPNNNIKKVYDAMSAKYNMEEPYEVFEKNMTDGENRKAVYDALTQKYNMLDSFEDFEKYLGITDSTAPSSFAEAGPTQEAPKPQMQQTPQYADSQYVKGRGPLRPQETSQPTQAAQVDNTPVREVEQPVEEANAPDMDALDAQLAEEQSQYDVMLKDEMDSIAAKYPNQDMQKIEGIADSMMSLKGNTRYIPSSNEESAAVTDVIQAKKKISDMKAEGAAKWAKEHKAEIDAARAAKKSARKKEASSFLEAMAYGQAVTPVGGYAYQPRTMAEQTARQQIMNAGTEAAKTYADNKAIGDMLQEAVQYADNAIAYDKDGGSFGGSLGRGFLDSAARISTWDFGWSDVIKNGTVASLFAKMDRGEQLTEEEEAVMDALALASTIQRNTQDAAGVGYNVGASLPQSLGFMASLYLNPASGLGKKAMTKAMRKYGKRWMAQSARYLGDVGEMLTATATSGGMRTAGQVLDKMTGEADFIQGSRTPDGEQEYIYTGQKKRKEAPEAIVKGFLSQFIENWTEATGEYMRPMLNAAGKKVFDPMFAMLGNLTKKGLKKGGLNGLADAISNIPKTEWGKMMNAFKNRVKWNGPISEVLEEEVGMVLQPLLEDKGERGEAYANNFGIFSKDEETREKARTTQITTALSCAFMSGAFMAVDAVGLSQVNNDDNGNPNGPTGPTGGTPAPRATWFDRLKVSKNLWTSERNLLKYMPKDEVAELQSRLDNAEPSEMVDILKDYMWEGDVDDNLAKKHAILNYACALVEQQSFNATTAEARAEMDETTQNMHDAYLAGTSMASREDVMNYKKVSDGYKSALDALQQYDQENGTNLTDAAENLYNANQADRENVMNGLNDNEKELVSDYLNYASVWHGLYDGIDAKGRDMFYNTEAHLLPAMVTDAEGNETITTATTAEGTPVYVTGSSGSVSYILDEEGNKVAYPTSQLSNVQTSPFNEVVEALNKERHDNAIRNFRFYTQHNPKTQEPQIGMVIGDGNTNVIVTDMGKGWATIQETMIDPNTGKAVVDPNSPSRDVSTSYLLALQDDIYDKRDEMDKLAEENETENGTTPEGPVAEAPQAETPEVQEPVAEQPQEQPQGDSIDNDVQLALQFIEAGDNDYLNMKIEQAEKELDEANKAKPTITDDDAARLAQLQGINDRKAAAKANYDHWKEVERRVNDILNPKQEEQPQQTQSNPVEESVKSNYTTRTPQFDKDGFDDDEVSQTIDAARAGDQEAIQKLADYGIKYGATGTIYRYISKGEYDAIMSGKRYMGRSGDGRVDVTNNSNPSTGASTEYRVTFKPQYDMDKNDGRTRMKNAELGDGFMMDGYGLHEVQSIEKMNPDGTYTTVYSAEQQEESPLQAKFNGGNPIVGREDVYILPNGTEINGHYVIVEQDALTPSHDASFRPIPEYGTNENGSTLNDRDYEHDKDAQAVEKQKAQNYDKRAYQEPVVVTPDGRVFSGNGRTISGMIAAENGTDTKYVNSLKRDARFYGFEDGAVDGYNHPRLVFVVDDDIPFTSDNIAMFNADSRKTQNKTERMVKAGKVISDTQYEKLARIVEDYDTLDDLYNKGAARLMRVLQDEGIINPNDVAQYMEGDQLSQMGRDYVEGLLIGYALNGSDDSVRMLMSDGMGNVRKSFMYALRQVVANRTLGEYALNKEIEEAINICYEAHRKFGGNVDGYLRQKSIFGDTLADRTQELSQMFSTFMNSGSAALRDVLDVYNNSYTDELAQENMFGERDRESAINDIINYINNKYGQTGSAQTSNRGSGQQTSGSSEENQPAEQGGTGVADVAATGNGINEQDIRTGAAEEGPQNQEEVKTGPVGTVREITNSRTGEPAWIVEGDIDDNELDALRRRAKAFGGYYTNRGGVRGFVFTNEDAANQFNDRAITEYTAPTAQEQPTTGDNGDIYAVAQQVADERGGVTRNESEIEDQMPILTREEVLNSGAEQDDIDAALDYLDGDRGLQAQIGYKKISDYVRSKQGGAEQVGTTEGQSQLVGTDNGTNGPEQAGRSGVESGSVGEEGNGGNVSELGIRGENGSERTATDNGEGGNSEPASEGRGPVSGTADGGRRTGSRSDGRDGRNVRGGRREATGNADTTEDTGRGTDTESGGNNSLEGQLDDLKGLFDDWKKAGRNGTLNASIVGMNNEQIEILGKILKKSIQIGVTLIQKGVHTLSSFANAMRKYIGDSLKSIFGYSDQEVDDFINECWNSKVTINGERKRLCEFASEMGDEDLRKELKKTLAEKRKEQADAEKIEETIICDEDNIRATLPYLLPEQRHDVYLAENQFFTEEHADREHGYGKGYMFTNGTGTGKTYTGLGIMKRFIRQGKTRILVLTPTQEKVTDWVNDARNLQLQLTRLDNTQDAGTGAVITTYANFRANNALMKDDFDLVVYDESHRIIENKFGEETTGAQQHYMVTNRNDEAAYDRLTQNNPVWIRGKEIDETLKLLNKDLTNAEYDGESDDKIADLQQKIRELEQEQKDNQEQKQQLEPELRKRAAEAAKRTKVVFLSATPFNTAMGLEYAEGYIFSYPEEEAAENNAENGTQPTDKKKSKKSARETFLLDTFGSSYRYKNGRLAMDFTNPVAAAEEEIGFSDMLQNVLHTMSGRIIDSEYDYSRDFPEIKLQQSFAFNGALGDLQNDPVISPIAKYFGYLDDYNWFGYIIESIKVHEFIPRIKEHLARGRQVVIFHRRQNETKSNKLPPAGPPFAIGLMQAAAATQDQNLPRQERELIQRGIDEFMSRYSALLEWEQKLDYRPVVEQISEAFATDKDREEYQKKLQDWQKKYDKAMAEGKNPPRMPKLTASMVGYFSGEETKNAKHNDVLSFNSDEGDKQIIVVQESSGKEGISLHDTTGKKQRVLMSLALPQSPITFIQQEGRIYRIGNRSNAIFEYPLIGIAKELNLFAGYFNTRAETTENLALGSKGRGLRDAIKRGIMERRGVIPLDGQGIGGKEFDKRIVSDLHKGYEGAIARFKDKTINWGDEQGSADIDDFPTPEPIAFKMVEWAQIEKGENVLEPSAGEGQILRYIPETVETKFLEPSQDKGSMLNVEFSSNIKSLDQHTFENYNVVNKHDVIIMAPPSGVGANTAFKHMNKAFKHLNEGGRMVILVPEGDNFDQRMTEFMTENPTSMVTANISLPECGLSYGGISLKTRALVIDKVSRRVARDKFNAHVEADLSDIKDIDTLFNELKNMKVPARKVDEIAKMMRIAKKFKTQFVKTGMIAKSSDGKEDMYWVTEDGVSFDTAHTKKTNIRGWFGFNFNNFRPTLAKNYGRNFTIVKDDYLGKEGDDFIRSTSNSYWNPYAPEKANEVRAFWEAYCDLIQELSGLTEAQIRRVSMGLSQEINVSDLGETVDMQSLSEKFDVAVKNSPNADIKRKLFKQVTAVAQTSGIKLSINHSNANDAGTYVLNEHGLYLNDRVWNRLDNNKRADVILHEFIHSVTTYALQMSEIEHQGFASMAQMNAFSDTPLIIINTCHEIENIYNVIMHGIESAAFAGSYAINNPHEMMAELADDETRAKYENRKVWYKEENGVRKYFGFQMDGTTESNALVELERALQTLLTEFDQNTLDNIIDIVNGNTGYMKTPHIVDTEAMMADDEFKNETDAENLATDFILDILSDRIIRVSDDEAMVEVINRANNFEMQAQQDGRDVKENLNDGTYGNIQFLRDGSKIYGYRKLGKIYLTNHGINANSPVHEYTHIWASAMMKNNRDGWNDIVRLLKGTDVWNEVVADENYRNLKTDDQIASEVLSRISGRENSQKVIAEAQAVIDSTPDMYEAARKQTLLNRLKEALNKFWNWVSTNIFHMRFNSVDEITDRILYDMIMDTDLNEEESPEDDGGNRKQPIFISNAAQAVANAKQGKATPEQWLAILRNTGGLKAGEDKWIGLSEWLNSQDKKSLTKEEVLDYISQNAIQVEETDYAMVDEADMEERYPTWNKAFYAEEAWFNREDGLAWVINNSEDALKLYNENNPDKQIKKDEDGEISDDDWDEITDWANREWNKALYDNHSLDSDRLRYTSEGLDNNREIALTVPTIEAWNTGDVLHFGDAGGGRAVAWARFGDTETGVANSAATIGIMDELEEKYGRTDDFDKMSDEDAAKREFANYIYRGKYATAEDSRNFIRSTYGDERADNIIRIFNDMVAENDKGKQRVLFIDEIQSKRHQEGRNKGYKIDPKQADKDMDDFIARMHKKYDFTSSTPYADVFNEEEMQELDRLNKRQNAAYFNHDAIPDAPFDKNWPELVMKRMLRLAAEEGYDKLAWTSGEQQADRYSLGQVLNHIEAGKWTNDKEANDDRNYGEDSKSLTLYTNSGEYSLDINRDGKVLSSDVGELRNKKLSEVIGKELAVKIMTADKPSEWSGESLHIGGEGMKAFYDKMLVDFMNKYGKKWGVKVNDIELPNVDHRNYKYHSIDITPEMREAVMQGQPMFQIVADQIKKAAKQNFGSAATSLNQVPAGFKKIDWVPFTTNLDLGGGKFDTATEYLKKQGVKNLVFDPYNRSAESNREIAKQVRDGGVDTSTCMNVLNVIDTPEARSNVILQCAKAIKKGGTSYFSVYEGDKSGVGRQTKSDSWQNNMPLKDYVDEVKAHFADVKMKNGLIIAKNPIIKENGPKSIWNMDASGNESIEFNIADENTNDVFNRAIEEYGITSSSRKAGYMLPDGRYLDFSEGSDRRTQDHRNVGIAYEDTVDEKYKYMVDFMKRGAIRMKPESDGFELIVEPTPEQRRVLRQFIASRDGNVMVDIYDPVEDETISAEYTDVSPSMVLGEIDRYFREGIKPQGNEGYIRYREDNTSETQQAADIIDRYDNQDGSDKYPYMTGMDLIDAVEGSYALMDDERVSKLIGEYHNLEVEDREQGRRDFAGGEMEDLINNELVPLLRNIAESTDTRYRDELPTDRRVGESAEDFYKRIREAYTSLYRDLAPTAIYKDGMTEQELAKALNVKDSYAKAMINYLKNEPDNTLAVYFPTFHRIAIIQRDDAKSARDVMTTLFHENVHAFFSSAAKRAQEETMANDIKNLVRSTLTPDEITKFDNLSEDKTREIIAYGISQFMDENKIDELYDALDGFGKNLLDDYLKSIRYDKEYEKERRNVGRYGENPSEDRPSSNRRNARLSVFSGLDRQARRLADKLGYNVRLIASEDDLTDAEKAKYGRRTKGWFDTRTGDIYVYLPMASSINDVKRTILHEVVGHKGLRKIIGSSYDRYMDELYGRLPKREQERIRKMATEKYKGSISVAMDEYLAEFAENGLQKPSVWQIVKSYIRDLFSRLFDIELKPADIRYMLWRSQKAMRDDSYVDMAKDRKLRDIIFREDEEELEAEAANIESAMKSAIRNDYEEAVNKALFRLRMSWQDSMLAAKKLIEKFGERHVTIKDFENIWMAENRLSSQTTYDKNAYSKAFAIPLIEHLNKMAAMLGTRFKKVGNMLNMTSYMDTIRDILDYMMAEHGLERNDVFAMRDARKEFNTSDEYAKLRGDLDTAWRNYQNDPTDQHLEDIYNQTKQQADDEINKLYKKYRKNDYSGLTTMFGFDKDEVDDAEQKAKELINNFKQKVGQDAVDELWRLTNAATKETLRKVHDGGLISDDTYNEVSNMFQHYIPLRGFKEEVAEDVYNYIDHPKGPFNAPMQTAKGRHSVADNPIANILSMADSGITSANRNRLVGLTTLALTRNHPNDLLIENQVYLVKKTDANGNETWEVAIPDEISNSAKPEEVEAAMAKFNEQMEQLVQADEEAAKQAKKNGQQYDRKYMRAKQSPNTKYFVNKKQLSEHHILVKENGRPVLLTVAGNPVLAQAINGKTEYNTEDNVLNKIFGNLTRWSAAGMTQLNIDFIAPNFVRDFGQSADMVFVEDGFRHYLKFRKNQLKAIAMTPYLVARNHNDKLNMQKKYDRLYQQFIENGGPTGYERIMGSDAYKTQLLQEFRQLNRSAFSPVKWIQWYFKLIGFANEVAETSTRFAKFITSMDEGRSLNKSILDAKNVSTNFSKRGSFGVGVPLVKPEGGEEVSVKRIAQEAKYLVEQLMEVWLPKITRPMYAFLNASMQGLEQRLRGFGSKEMRARAVGNALYEIGLGLANSYLAYVVLKSLFNSNGDGDDDDDKQNEKEINDAELFRSKGSYGMLPSYVKRQNIVLPTGNGKFICIPLGIEKRSFFGLGQLLGEIAYGEKNYTSKQIERELMDIMGDLMPINAFEEGGYGLSPTFLKPFKEAKHNQSWSGGHIWYDSDYNKDDPNWTKAYNGTNPILVGISKDLYEKFERDFHQGSMADINPAKVEYILEQTFSGRLRTFNQLYKIANSVKEDEQVRLQDIPVLNRFYKQSTGKAYEHAVNNEFYENKEFCDRYMKGIANMENKLKDYNLSNEEYSDLEHDYDAEVESNAYRAVMNFLDEYNRIIKRENKAYKKTGDDDIKDDQINQKARMNLEFYESMRNVLNE